MTEMTTLKDGSTVEDPRLDRLKQFDERSRDYPIRALVGSATRRKKIHTPPKGLGFPLDQGREGACVGYAISHDMAGSPIRQKGVNDTTARELYYQAQREDPWAGGAYPGASPRYDGTSVLAGIKVAQKQGFIDSYRWAFGIDEVIDGIINGTPTVFGIPWLEGMYTTRPSGMVEVHGRKVGGHAIYVFGYHPGMRIKGEGWFKRHEVLLWLNSWGPNYGKNGIGYLKVEDAERLLKDGGESVFSIPKRVRA